MTQLVDWLACTAMRTCRSDLDPSHVLFFLSLFLDLDSGGGFERDFDKIKWDIGPLPKFFLWWLGFCSSSSPVLSPKPDFSGGFK
jgi:hypothetical protein